MGVSSSGDGMGDGVGGWAAPAAVGWSSDVGVIGVAVVGAGGGRFSSVGSEFESKPNRLFEKWKPFRLVEWSKSSNSWNEVKKLMPKLEVSRGCVCRVAERGAAATLGEGSPFPSCCLNLCLFRTLLRECRNFRSVTPAKSDSSSFSRVG